MLPRTCRTLRPLSSRFQARRPLSTSPFFRKDSANKDWTDREEIRPTANEYSKSGSDADSAAVDDTAFSRDNTRPEESLNAADKESGEDSNPLNVSPANHDLGKPGDPAAGGPESSSRQSGKGPTDRASTSGRGSPNKGSQGKKYD